MNDWFWSKVNKLGPIHPTHGRCWLWSGCVSQDGYGKLKRLGVTLRSHRVSYQLSVGDIDDGLWVLHKCDTPLCVNPDHLFLGTPKDNNADMIAKGRNRPCPGDLNGSRKHPERMSRGEKHGKLVSEKSKKGCDHYRSTLTPDQVKDIRSRAATKEFGIQTKLARKYGISSAAVSRIVHRVSYLNV